MFYILVSILSFVTSCTPKNELAKINSSNLPIKSALSQIQDKIKTSPSYENYITLGMEFSALNNNLAAINAYEAARDINPKAPLAWNNLCAEYNKQNKFANAVTNCKKAVELEPQFQLAKSNLKYATESLEATKKNLAQKKSSLTKNKIVIPSETIDLGMGFYNINDFETAIELWSKIKKGNTTESSNNFFAIAQNNLATVYIILKDFTKAEKHLENALEVQPKNQLFLNNKKWLNDSRKQAP
ncbi:MAG: hypothetical protein ABL927_10500 [Bdellovibrionales bacterium]